MTEIALITGASSGLGREFAMQISRSEERPQEIWAVARRENRLEELQKLCGIPVRPIPLDLTRQESIRKLEELLQKEKPVIRILVNAAGIQSRHPCEQFPIADWNRVLEVNLTAPFVLSQMAAKEFLKKEADIPRFPGRTRTG